MDDQNSQNANRDIFNIANVQGDVKVVNYDKQPRSRQEFNARKRLLNEMRTELAGRKPLHQAAMLNLRKEEQPHQVQRPWDVSVKVGEQRSFQLPSETSILEVFEEPTIGGKLLILGKAGSGKTTTLLELAQGLCDRAEMDSNAPIPVILELSSWQPIIKRKFPIFWEKEQYNLSIKEWISYELQKKGLSKRIAEQWIRHELVLLLDGLDEMPSERQAKCVQAINLFLESQFSPQHLVVCSRKEEYENYADTLHLNGAIYLEDLSVEQIQNYFIGIHLEYLWDSIKNSEKIVNFIRRPLFLAIISIAYQQINIEEWINCNTEERATDYLLGIYRVLTISKDAINKDREEKVDSNRVIWLAKYMKETGQKEFIVRQISPVMLLDSQEFFENMGSLFDILIFIFVFSFTIWSFQYHSYFYSFLPEIFRDYGFLIAFMFSFMLSLPVIFLVGMIVIINVIFNINENELKMLDKTEVSTLFFILIEIYVDLFMGLISFIKKTFKSTPSVYILIIILISSLTLTTISSSGNFSNTLQVSLSAIASSISQIFFLFTYALAAIVPIVFTFKINKINNTNINVTREYSSKELSYALQSIHCIFLAILWFFYYKLLIILTAKNFEIPSSFSEFIPFIMSIYLGILWGGGYALWRHSLIRFALFKYGYIYWNISRFLDYCTKRLILQRVGNRYRFIHPLVQEHFASLKIQKFDQLN